MPHILTITSEQYRNMFKSTSRRGTFSDTTHPTPSTLDTGTFDVGGSKSLALRDFKGRPSHFGNSLEEYLFIFTIMMATAASSFLLGAIVINTTTIAKNLEMTVAQTQWIVASIDLASGAFTLFFGKPADVFEHKHQVFCGMVWISIFSLATAFAPSPIAMNVLCGFLALGTAIIYPPATRIMLATYPENHRRNKAMVVLGAANPIGFTLGSISSGVATKYWSWRAAFCTNSVFFFLMAVLSLWTMPKFPKSGNVKMQMRQFDYLGTALMTVGMALVFAGLTHGPELGWNSIPAIVMVTLGLVCIVGFGVWESVFRHPLLNPVVWKNRSFALCILSMMFGYMSFITNLFWMSLYMQEVQKLAPLQIAIRLLPQAIAGILWSYVGQTLTRRINCSVIMGIGGVAYVAGAILIFFIRKNSSYWHFMFPALLVTVIGFHFQSIISNLLITKQIPRHSSLATNILQSATRLSIPIGLAITAVVYGSQKNSRKDVNLPYSRAYLCSILFSAIGLVFIPFMHIGTPDRKATIDASDFLGEEEKATGNGYDDDEPNHQRSTADTTKIPSKPTECSSSTWSNATEGTVTNFDDSYFPRWSWEDNSNWDGSQGDRYQGAEVVYEICIKCREERKVIVGAIREVVDGRYLTYGTDESAGSEGQVTSAERAGGKRGGMLWNGGQWNKDWDIEWYAQRGVKEGGHGWV